MALYNIPKVYTSEIDLTTHVNLADGSTYAAYCGDFQWGPCGLPVIISDENTLVETFSKPTDENYVSFFSASSYLSYSSSLNLVRVADPASRNAVTGNTSVLVKNDGHYINEASLVDSGAFIANYPGTIGNSLFIAVCDSDVDLTEDINPLNASFGTWGDYFITKPGTSENADMMGGQYDEMHILIFDEDGLFTGSQITLLEKYEFLSKATNAKRDGVTNYYRDIINNISRYVRCGDEYPLGASSTSTVSTVFEPAGTFISSFSKAVDVDTSNTSIILDGYDLFANKKTVPVSHFITGDYNSTVINSVVNIAENRGDCVVFISPQYSDVQAGLSQSEITENCKIYKNSTLGISSSYCFMDNNWAFQYDKYNDKYRWIPCNPHIAGISSKTDSTNSQWVSPAGYSRGVLKRVEKLAWNAKEEYLGELYGNNINSIVFDAGNGIVLMGDKTALSRPSAFDRINVRKLFNLLKVKIADYLKYSLFEINDEFTRAQIKTMLDSYLLQVKGQRGLYDFEVICNEINNTGEIIDSNTLVCDIYIKPARSINFIKLNMIAVGSSVSFSETVGRT